MQKYPPNLPLPTPQAQQVAGMYWRLGSIDSHTNNRQSHTQLSPLLFAFTPRSCHLMKWINLLSDVEYVSKTKSNFMSQEKWSNEFFSPLSLFWWERYENTSAIFALGEKSVKIRESHLPRYPTTNHYKLEHIRYEKGNTRWYLTKNHFHGKI